MKNNVFTLLVTTLLYVASTAVSNAHVNILVMPCILVNNVSPTTGNPDYYYKCKSTSIQLSIKNCGSAGNTISTTDFAYTWVNTTTGSFTYTSPTVNTDEAGRWIVTITYTDPITSITYIEKDTLDLLNYTETPIAINNGVIAGHCPYDPLTFTATSSPQIISNSYKWYLNNTAIKDTNVTVSSSGNITWATTILTQKYVTVSATDNNGCKIIANISSPLLLTPIAPNIGTTHLKCSGKNIILTAAAQAGNTYSWDGGTFSASNIFTTSISGKHWVTVQRGLGCKLADTTFISEYPISVINIGSDTSLCYMESGQLNAKVSGTPNYSYSWAPASYFSNPAIANPTISIVPITTVSITLTVTDGNSCTNTATKNVTHLAQGTNPYLNISAADLIICDGTTKFFDTNVSATYPTTYSYEWTPNTFLNDPNIKKPIVDLNGTGTSDINYSLKVTDFKGCYTTISTNAKLVPSLTTSVVFSDTSVCHNSVINLFSSYTGGTAPITQTWSPSQGLSANNIANPIATVTQSNLYTITTSDVNGCSASKTVDVKDIIVKVILVASDTTGYNVEPLVLNPIVNSTNYNYSWKSNNTVVGTSKILSVTEPGTYKVTATDPISLCYASDSINVVINDGNPRALFVPNVLNPNSNNDENNKVKVYGIAIKEEGFAFRIYNKWGQLIYETSSFIEANNKGWAGAYQGNSIEQNQSVYTYTLHGLFFDGVEFNKTGSITLLR